MIQIILNVNICSLGIFCYVRIDLDFSALFFSNVFQENFPEMETGEMSNIFIIYLADVKAGQCEQQMLE